MEESKSKRLRRSPETEPIPFQQIVGELLNKPDTTGILDIYKGKRTRIQFMEEIIEWARVHSPENKDTLLAMSGPLYEILNKRRDKGVLLTRLLNDNMPLETFDRSIYILATFGKIIAHKAYSTYVTIDTGAVDNVMSLGFVRAIEANEWIDSRTKTEVVGVTNTTQTVGVIYNLAFHMVDMVTRQKRLFRANFMVVDSPDPEMILIGQTFLRSYGSIIEQNMHETDIRFTVSFKKNSTCPFSGPSCHPRCVNDRIEMDEMRLQRALLEDASAATKK